MNAHVERPQLSVAVPKWRKYLYRSLFVGVLTSIGIFVFSLYVPLRTPELLPLPPAHPVFDGSYPELLIRNEPTSSGHESVSYSRNSPSLTHDSAINQFEVNLSTGKFVVRQTDLFETGAIPISLTRTYDSFDSNVRSFGVGTSQPYDVAPAGSRFPYTFIDLELEDGDSIHFERISKGTGFTDAIYEHRATSSKEFFGARIRWNVDEWKLSLPGGSTFIFPEAYDARTLAEAAITEIRSVSGQRVKVSRSHHGNIRSVISSSGHRMDFSYDDSGRIIEVRDEAGHDRRYSYNSDGCLESVADGSSILYRFEYFRTNMTRIMDGGGREILGISYDGGRVSEILLAGGESYGVRYDVDSSNQVVRTVVSDPGGRSSEFDFR